jgi:hypothetical protein
MVGSIISSEIKYSPEKGKSRITLPPRTESIVRVPVTLGSPEEGIIPKREIQEGVFMAATLTRVVGGCVLTSILNVNEAEVEITEPVVRLDEIESERDSCRGPEFEPQDREHNIIGN